MVIQKENLFLFGSKDVLQDEYLEYVRIIQSFSCRTSFYYYLSSVQLWCLDHVVIAIPVQGQKPQRINHNPITSHQRKCFHGSAGDSLK